MTGILPTGTYRSFGLACEEVLATGAAVENLADIETLLQLTFTRIPLDLLVGSVASGLWIFEIRYACLHDAFYDYGR